MQNAIKQGRVMLPRSLRATNPVKKPDNLQRAIGSSPHRWFGYMAEERYPLVRKLRVNSTPKIIHI